jgi:hypothetical protein
MSFSNPIYVLREQAQLLERMPLAYGNSQFNEAWLQRQLFEQPHALPLKEIAPHLGEVAPICMELGTLAGPADILYVTPSGQVVLVETKLWRNPEARRTVVAQILDYAKELTAWHYEDLEREVAKATGRGPTYLLEAARQRFPNLDERAFVDGINHSLRTGEIVLLIVGDGIRTGTEALVSFLERYGSLRFTFGLVEVAAYRLNDGVLLCPRVLAKTEVVRRTVAVAVDQQGQELPVPAAEPVPEAFELPAELTPEQRAQAEYGQWLSSFWKEFLTRLRLDDTTQPRPTSPPRSTNAFFQMPPGGGRCWVSAYVAKSLNSVGVYLSLPKSFEKGPEIYEYLKGQRDEIDAAVGEPLEWIEKQDGSRTITLAHPLGDWRDPQVRDQQIDFLARTTNTYINTFRPRLHAYFREQVES